MMVGCLSETTIQHFFTGGLASDEMVHLERHTDACLPCRVLLSQTASVFQSRSRPRADDAPPSLAPHTFAPGDVVAGRYAIRRFLGQGGMGEVYEAEDGELHERIALKTVNATTADDERMVRRLKAEVQLA